MSAVDVPGKDGSEAARHVLMRSLVRVEVTDGPDKLVWLPTGHEPVAMGMHDELAVHYGAAPGSFVPHASTLDYVVGAVAACLTGTFKRSLTARGVRPAIGDLRAEAVGEIVIVDSNVPVIRAIEVRYRLTDTDPDDHERITRAHAVHHRACAVSRSVERAIDITTVLELV